MAKQNVLLQIDPDPVASSFDAIVAIDSGVDHLLQYANVKSDDVQGLVHGTMFTRGPDDLKHTAMFFGGSNIEQSERLAAAAKATFFGPMRVSLMSDPNGSNTTAVAAVLSAEKHITLSESKVAVLGGTGPVGMRIAQLCAGVGAVVRLASRSQDRANEICNSIRGVLESAPAAGDLEAIQCKDAHSAVDLVAGCDVVFAAGAAGVELLASPWQALDPLPRVIVDLNAVPPAGIAHVQVTDAGRDEKRCLIYGAIGVGGLKMKIHRQCISQLFQSNDQVLELNEIYEVARGLN